MLARPLDLNQAWKPGDGGELRLFPRDTSRDASRDASQPRCTGAPPSPMRYADTPQSKGSVDAARPGDEPHGHGSGHTQGHTHTDGHERHVDIEPIANRAVVFWSDKRVPHEVLPSKVQRFALSVWFSSSAERDLTARRRLDPSPTSTKPLGAAVGPERSYHTVVPVPLAPWVNAIAVSLARAHADGQFTDPSHPTFAEIKATVDSAGAEIQAAVRSADLAHGLSNSPSAGAIGATMDGREGTSVQSATEPSTTEDVSAAREQLYLEAVAKLSQLLFCEGMPATIGSMCGCGSPFSACSYYGWTPIPHQTC